MRTLHLLDPDPKQSGRLFSQGVLVATALTTLSISVVLLQQVNNLQEELRQLGQDIRRGNSTVIRRPLHVSKELSKDGHRLYQQGEPDLHMRNPSLLNQSLQALLSASRGHRKRTSRETRNCTNLQPFIQLVPAESQPLLMQGDSTLIPWAVSLTQGEALEMRHNRLVIEEDSYYLVFGQVLYYQDDLPMGHLIRRRKRTVSGTDLTILLRCIKNMPKNNSNTSCYSAGVAKLERGDELELIISDRPQAKVSLDGDSTFFGAIQLL